MELDRMLQHYLIKKDAAPLFISSPKIKAETAAQISVANICR
jgi:hypothetical protein